MTEAKSAQRGFADINGTRIYYEVAGQGHPLVLIHGGLVDRRLWDDQFDAFAQRYKVIRYDMRGFGDSGLMKTEDAPYSFIEDLYSLLKFLGIEKTYVLGLSMGGGLDIDFTLAHPEMVDALIPVASGLSGFEESNENEQLDSEMQAAFERGDIPRAVEISLQWWTDGPRRTPEQVNPAVRERIREMTTHNFERPDDQDAPEPQELEPPAASRLSEISVPTLIIVGDEDVRDILRIADKLEAEIPGAKKVVIPGTAHHLNMEKPQEFNTAVLGFLGEL